MKNFALTGIAGYIAPRHLQAIKETGNNLVAALDPHDSVGVLDQYFPEASYFREFERFERHLDLLRRKSPENKIDYLSICSPNYLHDSHIRLALQMGADAICEKPLVLNPWNLDALEELEKETGRKIYTILQLRVHPSLIALKEKLSSPLTSDAQPLIPGKKHKVDLTYITSRGPWYDFSWKGDITKSGGIATNIGIHFFDLLIWLLGKPVHSKVISSEIRSMKGELELENADVNWHLSINKEDLPEEVKNKGGRTYRSIKLDGEEIEFTEGFTKLHTVVFNNILNNCGFGLEESRASIELTYSLRNYQIP